MSVQADAQNQSVSLNKVVSTDPPYYDNIGYADLSDFFYVWLRRALKPSLPDLFATIAVPKAEELVATPYRHGGKEKAEAFFLDGMTQAMHRLAKQAHPAFRSQSTTPSSSRKPRPKLGTSITGWETFLDAVIRAGFALTGTWPMRTERGIAHDRDWHQCPRFKHRSRLPHTSSQRATISRREFLRELNGVLPEALDEMTKGAGDDRSPVAPVDLSQAIIGPGMAVFSKYAAVLEADGSPMSVRTALQLINRFLAEDDFDADTQFCLHWFEQHGWKEGRFRRSRHACPRQRHQRGWHEGSRCPPCRGGKVRLLKWAEYPTDWDPRPTRACPSGKPAPAHPRLKQDGETASGALLAALRQSRSHPPARLSPLHPLRTRRLGRRRPRLQRTHHELDRHRIRRRQRPSTNRRAPSSDKESDAMKPWREIIVPHPDVLDGTFQQSEFAADITAVHTGKASREYRMQRHSTSAPSSPKAWAAAHPSVAAAQWQGRRAGHPTANSLRRRQDAHHAGCLSLGHAQMSALGPRGHPALLDQAGLMDVPQAQVAVLDGTAHAPGQPWKRGKQAIRTLWGELAWQLGGAEGFALVQRSRCHRNFTGQGCAPRAVGAPCALRRADG